MPNGLKEIKATFVNIVKITQVDEIDYIFHFFNTYSGERWVFKLYKALFDKGFEIRKIVPLEVTTSEDEEDKEVEGTGAGIYA